MRSSAISRFIAGALLPAGCVLASLLGPMPAQAQERDDPAVQPPGSETAVSGPDADDRKPAATLHSTVLHLPPSEARGGVDLRLTAVVDAAWTEAALMVRYRPMGTGAFAESPFERSSAGGYFATIPGRAVSRPGIEYYIAGQLPDGTETLHFASARLPHQVIVTPSQAVRWAEKERARLGGHVSTVGFAVDGHNFGNRFGNHDRYLRGELTWTHRLLGALYAISLGYGFIEGETPDQTGAMAMTILTGARYGAGGVTLRLSRSLWLDGRAALGVSRGGLILGGGGAITFGQPWRSNVVLGVESMQALGPSFWVRLQWDTVPPFLMGAAIMKTDLPAATLANGSFIIYDVSYPITPRLTLRGSLSFGSRDGPGNFGGGLGAQMAF